MNILAGLELDGTEPQAADHFPLFLGPMGRTFQRSLSQPLPPSGLHQTSERQAQLANAATSSAANASSSSCLTQSALLGDMPASRTQPPVVPTFQHNPGLSTAAQVEATAMHFLACISAGVLPAVPFAVDPSQAAAAPREPASQQSLLVQPSASWGFEETLQPTASQRSMPASQMQAQAASHGTQSAPAPRAKTRQLAVSAQNSKVTDRFCRALLLMDAIHVRPPVLCSPWPLQYW